MHSKANRQTFSVCLFVVSPPDGHAVGVQKGHGSAATTDMLTQTTGPDLTFSLIVEAQVSEAGAVKFSGTYVQKDPKGFFIYLRWGQSAGDHFTKVSRRTKIYLTQITRQIFDAGSKVTLEIYGTAKDGLPACATVPVKLRVC